MNLVFNASSGYCDRIFLNDVPLAHLAVDGQARALGYLPQDVLVYSDSLRNNIAIGRPITDSQIMQLARELGLEEFLLHWPAGLDTTILEGGRNLSGGQKQRIGLLRAFAGSPSLMLMDEPEKNLDQATLKALVDYLRRVKHRCTCIIATQGSAFDALIDFSIDLSAQKGRP